MEQPLPGKDERIVSANSSADAVISRPSKDVMGLPEPSDVALEISTIRSQSAYTSLEQSLPFGYDNNMGNWDGYSQYVNPESLHIVPPVIYSDSPSLMFHSGYGFNPEVAYGQYSPVASPLPSMMVDGQLYPQHISFSPSYYPHPAPQSVPHISSTVSVLPNELVMPESSNSHNMLMGPGSGYLMASGSFGGILSGNPGPGPVQSPGPYAQPLGILGTYEHSLGQLHQQRGSSHGAGSISGSSRQRHSHANSYQNSTFSSSSLLYSGINDRNRPTLDKNRRRERDRDSICISNESLGTTIDINRGPRATKPKAKNSSDTAASRNVKHDSSTTSSQSLIYNQLEFATDYENAKFFIIKSFSEDNVHKSIKYSVWASTPHGNKKLDAAYHEAKEMTGNCPIFLFFSVNGSGQFCGVAEMVGAVDFEKDADYWQQDRWSGQFPVCWHIIKDISNSYFRHILLENNDNKPVTHSRDSQEVKLEQGIEMLKIFKNFEHQTSLIDDFDFYNERERLMKESKARQRGASTADVPHSLAHESVKQITDNFAHVLRLEENDQVAVAIEGVPSRPDASDSLSLGSIKQAFDSFARAQQTEGDGKSSGN